MSGSRAAGETAEGGGARVARPPASPQNHHRAMIGLMFALTGMAVFMIAIALMDAMNGVSAIRREINDAFDHDTKIFPDYEEAETTHD